MSLYRLSVELSECMKKHLKIGTNPDVCKKLLQLTSHIPQTQHISWNYCILSSVTRIVIEFDM